MGDPPTTAVLPIASTNVAYIANIPIPGALVFGTAGGRFATRQSLLGERTYFFATSSSGLTVIDATMPRVPLVVAELNLPHWENEDVDLGGNTLLISVDGSNGSAVYVVDITIPSAPYLRGFYKFMDEEGRWSAAYTGGGPGHIASCIQDCRYAWVTGASGGWVAILDLGIPGLVSTPTLVGAFHPPAGDANEAFTKGVVHDVNVDPSGMTWLTGSGGVSAYGVGGAHAGSPTNPVHIASNSASGLNTFILHNSLRPNAGSTLLVTEENWAHENGDCEGEGRFETYSFDGAAIAPISSWALNPKRGLFTNGSAPIGFLCSAHWFDYRNDGLVAIGWYQQGVRLLDVSDPARIRQVGWFLAPDAVASAAHFHPKDSSVIYIADYARGVDVIEKCEGACPVGLGVSVPAARAPRFSFDTSGFWGIACPRLRSL